MKDLSSNNVVNRNNNKMGLPKMAKLNMNVVEEVKQE